MLILVQIDISNADIALFDEYETNALALLVNYGATLEERLRSADGRSETHLLQFPDANALDAFRADPTRAELQELWRQCGAASTLTEVVRLAKRDRRAQAAQRQAISTPSTPRAYAADSSR